MNWTPDLGEFYDSGPDFDPDIRKDPHTPCNECGTQVTRITRSNASTTTYWFEDGEGNKVTHCPNCGEQLDYEKIRLTLQAQLYK